jgi:hypothetical protein
MGADSASDDERQYFLSLDRQRIGYEKGYWVTFRVRAVEVSEERPHGFQYSLSLHDRATIAFSDTTMRTESM